MVSETPRGRPRSGLGQEPGRWLTSARFLIRSLGLRGPAFLLALLAVSVGATVSATVLNLRSGLADKMSRELRTYGPNLLVLPARGSGTTLDAAAGSAALADRAGEPRAAVLLGGGSVGDVPATLVGTDFAALHRLYPGWRMTPPREQGGTGESDCVLGASLATRARLAPGDSAVIVAGGRQVTLRVAAGLQTGEAEDEQAFLPLAVLQRLTGLDGRVSYFALSVAGGSKAVEESAALIAASLPGAEARPLRSIARAQGAILERLDRMMFLLTFVILVLSGLCLATTLLSIVVEREGEVGLARAIGADDREILRMFLGEVMLLGIAGALLGIVAGAGLAPLVGRGLFGSPIEARLSVAPQVLLVTLLICFCAVLLPLRRALAIQPAAALRGD